MRSVSNYRYILEPYKGKSTRYICPKCGKREFVLYIDKETGEPINERVGRCNREIKCGYHLPPREYFRMVGKPITIDIKGKIDKSKLLDNVIVRSDSWSLQKNECSYINEKYVIETLKDYDKNTLANFLADWFDSESVIAVLKRYCVGTSTFEDYEGATIYWQKDIKGNYRTGKVMLYDCNGHRVKSKINWMHRLIKEYKDKFDLQQCIFGEHLLNNDIDRVCIVESEKTAIICDLYYSNKKVLWVACGGLSQLISEEKLKVFKDKKLILFPDLDGVSKWIGKKEELKELGFNVSVSEWYKSIKSKEVMNDGYDLADLVMDILKAKRGISKENSNGVECKIDVSAFDIFPFDNLNFNEEVQDIVQGDVDF